MKRFVRLLFTGFCLLAAGAGAAADNSPLHDAVAAGDRAKVEALLATGADINVKNDGGYTPLHFAAFYGNKGLAELLLARGANINARNEPGGYTPLFTAVHNARRAVVELLLARGADVLVQNSDGDTVLHELAGINGDMGERGYAEDVIELMLAKGTVNARDREGRTPLHMAVFYARKNIAELLLAKGADLHARDKNGSTLLHMVANHPEEMIDWLLAKGADIGAEDGEGRTPLVKAVWHRSNDVATLLLARGGDITPVLRQAHDLWATGDPGNRKMALQLYRAVHAVAPDDGWVLGQVGYALYRNGEIKEALPLLGRAAELTPDEISRYTFAAALFADGQHAAAAEQARWLVQQDPLSTAYLVLLGTTAHKTDRYREQVHIQRTLMRIDPQRANAVLYSQLGVGQAALGDCVAARDTLVTAVRAFPDDSGLHKWLVVMAYCAAGRTAAESVWQERYALRTYSDRAAFYQLVYYGIYDLAERAQRTGARYVALRHFARAYAAAREAASNTRVDAQWVAEERTQLRSRLFELYRALPLKPAIPAEAHALMQQGERALAAGDWRNASTQYAAAVEIAPWSPEARYNLGLAFGAALLNDLPQAIREMEFVQQLAEPGSPLARGASDRLDVWRERQRKALGACGGRVDQPGHMDTPQLILTRAGC